jgi:hypothetical protein
MKGLAKAQRARCAWRVSFGLPVTQDRFAAGRDDLDHLLDDGRGYPVISTAGRDRTGASFGSINDEFSHSRPDELADRSATLLASEEVPDLSPPEALFSADATGSCLRCPQLPQPWPRS